jgi:O-methyltransferase involved in polyketide biosynthesis
VSDSASDSARISPTAHYTGFVWYRNGLSPARLATRRGRLMFHALQGPMAVGSRSLGGLTLEMMLLQRHLVIDHLLDEAIRSGAVTQVVEIASGMSGRGHRFVARHPALVYIEADLVGMIARKRRALGARPARHQLIAVDALAESGSLSLGRRLPPLLEHTDGCAFITEGLLPYFRPDLSNRLLGRLLELMRCHPRALYVSDIHLADATHAQPFVRAFRRFLGVFARGEVHLFARDHEQLLSIMARIGFDDARVHLPAEHADLEGMPGMGPDVVRLLSARCGRW